MEKEFPVEHFLSELKERLESAEAVIMRNKLKAGQPPRWIINIIGTKNDFRIG
jgi:hypothetical protein